MMRKNNGSPGQQDIRNPHVGGLRPPCCRRGCFFHAAGLDAELWPQALAGIARVIGGVGATLEGDSEAKPASSRILLRRFAADQSARISGPLRPRSTREYLM